MNWKSILQQSWKKTLLVGGLLFIIGCAISFFLFANKMALLLIGLPFCFIVWSSFSIIGLLADILFWLLIAFFAVINKKFRQVVILILLIITVFTICRLYINSKSVQTGTRPDDACNSDKDCKIYLTKDSTIYHLEKRPTGDDLSVSQSCLNTDYKDPAYRIIETKEDPTKCACRDNNCEFINP